jgi:hypothetical protein
MRTTALSMMVAVGLWACGASDDVQPDASALDVTPGDSSHSDGAGDSPVQPFMDDAASSTADGEAGTDALTGDSASHDAQDAGGPTFACTGMSTSYCATGTEFCSIHWSSGELPLATVSCETLTNLPCFSTNAGCNCQNLAAEIDASGCTCSTADGGSELTLTCH